MKLLLFNKRHELAKLFTKWCKENNADDKDITNVITWLNLNDLLDVEKVTKYLEKSENNGK